jgi:dsDNA-specific endonuclease/ATPase MutS2
MNQPMTEQETELQESLARLQTLRDEVRVKLHLAGMDAKDEWQKLEAHIANVENAAQEFSEAAHARIVELLKKIEKFSSSLL